MNPALPEAPGAKAARVCGILAILFALTCIGIPVGIILGIVALVKNAKARTFERNQPDTYRRSSSVGMILGIAGLGLAVLMVPFAGIVSAIAIPAWVTQRERAREAFCKATLNQEVELLQAEFLRLQDTGIDQGAMLQALKMRLASYSGKNPYGPDLPAFEAEIHMIEATAEDEMQYQLEPKAKIKGQMVFAIAFPPNPHQPGYLAGAVLKGDREQTVLCNVVELK